MAVEFGSGYRLRSIGFKEVRKHISERSLPHASLTVDNGMLSVLISRVYETAYKCVASKKEIFSVYGSSRTESLTK